MTGVAEPPDTIHDKSTFAVLGPLFGLMAFYLLSFMLIFDAVTTYVVMTYFGAVEQNQRVVTLMAEYGLVSAILGVTVVKLAMVVAFDVCVRHVPFRDVFKLGFYLPLLMFYLWVVMNNMAVILS